MRSQTISQLMCVLLVLLSVARAQAETHRIFIGTYTHGDSASQGIYTATFNDQTGQLSEPVLAVVADNPSFLAVHSSGELLYAVSEVTSFQGQPTGAVNAYRVAADTGQLTLLNQQPTGGGAPCHCNLDATGHWLLVANYVGGNVAVFPVRQDGSLGQRSCLINHQGSSVDPQRQEAPHAHSINLSADNRYGYAADLGIDRVLIYRFDAQRGLLVPNSPSSVQVAAGGGPRHFSIHPSGQFAYTNNEMTATVTALTRNPENGGLTAVQNTSTVPDDFDGRRSTAECLTHPSGRFLYVSNRGHDSIAVFSIDSATGQLTPVQIQNTGGQEPRNFVISGNGRWLLAENQNSDTVVVFAIDPEQGSLSPTDQQITVGKPVCIRFQPVRQPE